MRISDRGLPARRPLHAITCLTALWLLSGCASPQISDSHQSAHVIICPGIGGDDPLISRVATIIARDCSDTTAQVWDWTRIEPKASWLNMNNLTDLPRNRRRADALARQLILWRITHPRERLYLVGFSGGTAIILFACEKLPADFQIEKIVFLASGLSPKADLRPALRLSRHGLVNFYSSNDIVVLKNFTTEHGTMDRQFCPSAGFCGFEKGHSGPMAKLLRQIPWTPDMKSLGNDGTHIGSLAPAFVRTHLVPLLKSTATTLPAKS